LYNELYKAWKAEKTSNETQPLADDFYQKTETYLGSIEQESASTDEHSAKGRLILKEKEVVTRLLRELRESRMRKLIALVQNGQAVDHANLTAEEKNLVKDFDKSLQVFNQARIEAKPALAVEETVEFCVVRFLQDIPEIVGTDLRMYGPYKKEDVGSLPSQNAEALVKQGAAKEIEVRGLLRSSASGTDASNNK
jgi:DNA replication factor GINS